MFDIAFTELMLIAVVALIVIGPEKLPVVSRTLGTMLGRLNRYVSEVKSDVQREMAIEEMKKAQAEIEAQAMSIERSVSQDMVAMQSALTSPAETLQQSMAAAIQETGSTLQGAIATGSPAVTAAAAPVSLPTPAASVVATDSAPVDKVRS